MFEQKTERQLRRGAILIEIEVFQRLDWSSKLTKERIGTISTYCELFKN
jgi:hypothetical protein